MSDESLHPVGDVKIFCTSSSSRTTGLGRCQVSQSCPRPRWLDDSRDVSEEQLDIIFHTSRIQNDRASNSPPINYLQFRCQVEKDRIDIGVVLGRRLDYVKNLGKIFGHGFGFGFLDLSQIIQVAFVTFDSIWHWSVKNIWYNDRSKSCAKSKGAYRLISEGRATTCTSVLPRSTFASSGTRRVSWYRRLQTIYG